MYKRLLYQALSERFEQPRQFIQALVGPRQVGKTTLARQLAAEIEIPAYSASADEPGLKGTAWIAQQWEVARLLLKNEKTVLLILDEIQKIRDWSETVKRLWDEDTASGKKLYVLLLGSTPLLLRQGLSESLAGRFEILHATHWTYSEMRDAFGWDVETYMFYGGYPGSASLISDFQRWCSYIQESLVETTIARDVLLMQRIDKPALFRRVFALACEYSGQILSYQKMIGQLQDVGNTTTLANYLNVLESAGMVAGIQKYAGEQFRKRGSSPKLQVLNNALFSTHLGKTLEQTKEDSEQWGRIAESSVGTHLLNLTRGTTAHIYYWRHRNQEVDFILEANKQIVAIEVKSGRQKTLPSGMNGFLQAFKNAGHIRPLLVGSSGIPFETFLSMSLDDILS